MRTTAIRTRTVDDARATFFGPESEHGPLNATLTAAVQPQVGAVANATLKTSMPPGELATTATKPIEVVVSRPDHGCVTTKAIPIAGDRTFTVRLNTPGGLFDDGAFTDDEVGDGWERVMVDSAETTVTL